MSRRNILALHQKIEIINEQEKQKLSVRELARRFNIGKTQAAEILRNKDAILAKVDGKTSGMQGFIGLGGCSSRAAKLDKLCLDWYISTAKANISSGPMSGEVVRRKALEIARKLGYTDFKGSLGWLQKWRIRHNIVFKDEYKGEVKSEKTSDRRRITRSTRSRCVSSQILKQELIIDDAPVKNEIYSDDERNMNEINSIYTYDEAFNQIDRLKEFVINDYISYQLLNNFESRLAELKMEWDKSKYKASTFSA